MACHKKVTVTCHAERQRSIWCHQTGGMAHVDASLPLSMTREETILMAYYTFPAGSTTVISAAGRMASRAKMASEMRPRSVPL
jgi:hypothetical protein